jgi:catechol 2,3-dioxygenase-like lactoylglutathione lyase family enzyme
MEPTIDHVALPAHNAETAARWLARILGVDRPEPAGPDGDMFDVALGGCSVLFVESDPVHGHHLAFRVSHADFEAVVDRLRVDGIPFGNDPEEPQNGQTSDPLGGLGRVYFTSIDSHLFEVTVG